MHRSFGVFTTDGIFSTENLSKMYLPLSELVKGVESHVRGCIASGLPIGMPSNISHDECRPFGWARATGVLLCKDMGRQLGIILTPETEADRAQIEALLADFYFHHHREEVTPYTEELKARLGGFVKEGLGFVRLEAAACAQPGLAAAAYPEFFEAGSNLVDKDGLVDYAALLARTKKLLPGVFHEPKRDLVLFAHCFFRRSLSHRNSLNPYALESFDRIATTSPGVTARLRLDPDLVGHPASARSFIELEYWRGPHFDDNIAAIRSGVTEHKAEGRARFFSGVDKTQIWWKAPEERRASDNNPHEVRTFEIEELIDDASGGLGAKHFGCRYAHAEYDVAKGVISHFDGAIRAYEEEPYLARIDMAIDRAGKHADYTKLFRIDGELPTRDWKRLLCDFFRGNELIPEYLGALDAAEHASISETPVAHVLSNTPEMPALCALVDFDIAAPTLTPTSPRLLADQVQLAADKRAPCVEVGNAALSTLLRQWVDPNEVCILGFKDKLLNVATIALNGPNGMDAAWADLADHLADAMAKDVDAEVLARVSLAVCWVSEGLRTTLSMAGEAPLILALLRDARRLVRPNRESAVWVEDLHTALRRHAPDLGAPVTWPPSAVTRGRLTYPRTEDVEIVMKLPKSFLLAVAPSQERQ
ncbi:MAG: hypothetical protein ACLP7P_21445 [Rhodomicrobium sp.]